MSYDLRHLAAPTLADQAYEELRSAILSGSIKAGDRLTDRGLAISLDVSPTPVREALRRLEHDHLVERSGPKTVRVASYSPRTLTEIALVADTLKALAAQLAAVNATDEELEAIERLLDDADTKRTALQQAVEQHGVGSETVGEYADALIAQLREFHDAINRSTHNPVILHLLRTCDAFDLQHRQRRLREAIRTQDTGPSTRYEEHRHILTALRARDAEAVRALMHKHAHSSSTELLDH